MGRPNANSPFQYPLRVWLDEEQDRWVDEQAIRLKCTRSTIIRLLLQDARDNSKELLKVAIHRIKK